jgi:uncharacterized protein (TIGR00255 family)
MTGYGRADFKVGSEQYTLEIKSLNHRYLDLKLKTPDKFLSIEQRITDEIRKRFSRGHFALFLRRTAALEAPRALSVDAVKGFLAIADSLNALGVEGRPRVEFFLNQRELFSASEGASDEVDFSEFKAGLSAALDKIGEWRKKEGLAIKEDLSARLSAIERMATEVAERAPRMEREYRETLTKRMEELIGARVDEGRLISEAALFAERSAISEELSRLKSHVERFREYLGYNEPVGRRLDFLCQELLREMNTVGSKVSDVSVTQTVVEMKGELEKIREQVQNIE